MQRASAFLSLTAAAIWGLGGGCTQGRRNPAPTSTVNNHRAVHILFGLDRPEHGIFPSDVFTVADNAQKTGLRTNLPLSDCALRQSDCGDFALINVLDGFNLQPRITVPFDGDIDAASVSSKDVFFIELGDADSTAPASEWEGRVPTIVGVNQLVWDPSTHTLAAESDEELRQHTRYAVVVTGAVRDISGAPVAAAEELKQFLNGSDDSAARDAVRNAYGTELRQAGVALRKAGIGEGQVAGLSVFTTESATAVLEHIRDRLKAERPSPANFLLGPQRRRTVFTLRSIQTIDWQQQVQVTPPTFQRFRPQYAGESEPIMLLDQYKPGAVERIAYGSFTSPQFIGDEPVFAAAGTRVGVPPVQRVETLYMNVFLPAGSPPPNGWPVVVFGLGGGDYKEEMPWFYAASFASHGLATVCINVVGQAYGPLSFVRVALKDGSVVPFPSGGRGKDLDRDGMIADNEGVATVSPAYRSLGARDAIRQQVVDLMQLVRIIEAGVDLDGDGRVDLDSGRISYFGISFGAGAVGHILLAVEPSVKVGVLASPGGMNSRFDLLRMRPAARAQVGAALASRVPSLLNPPGLASWDGIPVAPPFFNENIPLRNESVVINGVDGAMDIQRYFDNVQWIAASGDGASYAPHIRKEPLVGMPSKALLINFGKGDQSAPNPRTAQLIRAGGYADVATFYRNDLAYAEDNTVVKNPHTYLQRWMLKGLSGVVGRGGQEQVAIFLASCGRTIPHPEPARFFETPVSLPLPETFSYIH